MEMVLVSLSVGSAIIYAHEGKDPGADDPLVIYSYEFDVEKKQWTRRTVSAGGKVGWRLSPALLTSI